MKKSAVIAASIALLAFVPTAFASGTGEPARHYKGEPAKTLPEAVKNFSVRIPTNVNACTDERDRWGRAQAWGSDSNRVGHDHGQFGARRRLIHRRPPARLIRWRAGACG